MTHFAENLQALRLLLLPAFIQQGLQFQEQLGKLHVSSPVMPLPHPAFDFGPHIAQWFAPSPFLFLSWNVGIALVYFGCAVALCIGKGQRLTSVTILAVSIYFMKLDALLLTYSAELLALVTLFLIALTESGMVNPRGWPLHPAATLRMRAVWFCILAWMLFPAAPPLWAGFFTLGLLLIFQPDEPQPTSTPEASQAREILITFCLRAVGLLAFFALGVQRFFHPEPDSMAGNLLTSALMMLPWLLLLRQSRPVAVSGLLLCTLIMEWSRIDRPAQLALLALLSLFLPVNWPSRLWHSLQSFAAKLSPA